MGKAASPGRSSCMQGACGATGSRKQLRAHGLFLGDRGCCIRYHVGYRLGCCLGCRLGCCLGRNLDRGGGEAAARNSTTMQARNYQPRADARPGHLRVEDRGGRGPGCHRIAASSSAAPAASIRSGRRPVTSRRQRTISRRTSSPMEDSTLYMTCNHLQSRASDERRPRAHSLYQPPETEPDVFLIDTAQYK